MTYAPALITRFGGLQLSTDPREVSMEQSLAGVNCTLATDRSYLRTRDGTVRLGASSAMTGTLCSRLAPAIDATGADVLLAVSHSGTDVYLDSYAVSGALTALTSWTTDASELFSDTVAIGTPAANIVFVSTVGETLRKYSAGVAATSVGDPKYLGIMSESNRLIQGHYTSAAASPTGAQGSMSTVFFSDPGDPETFGANNYVILRPGDGEEMRGIASWRGQAFVFKESTAYVFSGESIDGTGEPIFDYRAIELQGRVPDVALAFGQAVAVGARGVYYLATDGVYRTTGGPSVKVSDALDEGFRSGSVAPTGISVVDQRVVLHTATTYYVLDERHGQWMAHTYPALSAFLSPWARWPALLTGLAVDAETVFFGSGSTLYFTSGLAVNDAGGALPASHQSGFGDLGRPGIKRLRQTRLTGTGSLTYKVGIDYLALDAGAAATLGASPTVGTWLDRNTRRGRQFSYGVASASGAWRLENLEMHLAGARPVAEVIA